MDEVLAAINTIAESLRADMAKLCEKMDSDNEALHAKYNAIADAMKKRDAAVSTSQGMQNDMTRRGTLRSDNDWTDPDNTMAERVAADSVPRSEFAALASSVAKMKAQQTRPMSDLNAFADAQSKADAVMRTHGERAEPPMAGEDIVSYQIRLARKMQPHSPLWKNVNLNIIAADGIAFGNALEAIRSDAIQAGNNPVHLKPFDHKEITEVGAGGHKITRFVGTGSVFKMMTRPVRNVAYIGTRNTSHL